MISHPSLPGSVTLLALKSHISGTPSVLAKVGCFVILPPRFCSLTDTGAMAVLALTCVKRRIINEKIEADEEDLNRINNHTELLVKKILSEKKENGLIGNTFSTGEAMQVSQRIKQELRRESWEKVVSLSFLIGLPRSYCSFCSCLTFDFTHMIPLLCVKCILLTFNLYLPISNASMKLLLTTIYLRNSRVYYNYNLSFYHM